MRAFQLRSTQRSNSPPSGGEFLQAFCTAAAHKLRETLLKQENALPEGRAFLHIFHACGCFLISNRHTATTYDTKAMASMTMHEYERARMSYVNQNGELVR